MSSKSAIPNVYYAIFAYYEPLLCVCGFMGTVYDPAKTYNTLAPLSGGSEVSRLPTAAMVAMMQLAHTCALLGVINFFVLSAVRRHLIHPVFVQEKIISALLTPLLFGDFFHIFMTLYGLGEYRWNVSTWPSMIWMTVVLGISLLVPRVCWHLGVGRYVASRDGHKD